MNNFIINCFIILLIVLNNCMSYESKDNTNCLNKIYRECSHKESYTEEEVENVRIDLQRRFAKTNPIRKPCSRLHVRKDIKCMSRLEINEFIVVVKKLYENGFMDRMTEIHA